MSVRRRRSGPGSPPDIPQPDSVLFIAVLPRADSMSVRSRRSGPNSPPGIPHPDAILFIAVGRSGACTLPNTHRLRTVSGFQGRDRPSYQCSSRFAGI